MTSGDEKKDKKEVESESYFNNKILKFLFNSKENVPQGIFIVNIVIFTFVSIVYAIILSITGGFEPTIIDKMFFAEVDNYSFLEVIVLFSLMVFIMVVSMIEVDYFHKHIENKEK